MPIHGVRVCIHPIPVCHLVPTHPHHLYPSSFDYRELDTACSRNEKFEPSRIQGNENHLTWVGIRKQTFINHWYREVEHEVTRFAASGRYVLLIHQQQLPQSIPATVLYMSVPIFPRVDSITRYSFIRDSTYLSHSLLILQRHGVSIDFRWMDSIQWLQVRDIHC